ncbi:MAG: glycine zipper 2TM domain-containing protein [Pseudomonadota bacterium]|nr:glycine zipper 2TM domain-containing protein [Pseudomonadota bacterium]
MKTHNLGLVGLAAAASMMVSGCATPYTDPGYRTPAPYGSTVNCVDCGTVVRIEQVGNGSNVPNATGAVLGGLVGAAAGRELADDESSGRRNTATVGGAVAGALAGNAIQNRMGAGATYNVHVRMNDGRTTVVNQNDLGGIREGSAVRVYNGRAWAR